MLKLIPALALILITSCSSPSETKPITVISDSAQISKSSAENFETGKIINSVFCRNAGTESYALYLPIDYLKDTTYQWPIVYFFDSPGDGSFPLSKYQSLGEKYHFILAGSNNSKNGNDWETTKQIWNNLLSDTKLRLRINTNEIYTAGFSGGAKVALFAAMNSTEVKSVVANSAAFPDVVNSSGKFSIVGLAGTGDMNMTEVIDQDEALDKTDRNHALILFDGKHEWAPLATMDDAFFYIYSIGCVSNKLQPDQKLTDEFISKKKAHLKQLLSGNQLLKARELCVFSGRTLTGISAEAFYFNKQENNLVYGNKLFAQQLQSANTIKQKETGIKNQLMEQFANPDLENWNPVINEFNSKSKLTNAEAPMYQRLLAFISLACYSLSNKYINQENNDVANSYVELYKKADPENAEAWYFSAMLKARSKNAAATEADLKTAIEKGFNDINRMQMQPEFQRMNTQIDFGKLIELIESRSKR